VQQAMRCEKEVKQREYKQQEKQKESKCKCNKNVSSRPKRRKVTDNVDDDIDDNRGFNCFGVNSDDKVTARKWV